MKRYRMLIGAAVIVALALAAYFSGLYRQPEEPKSQTPAKVTLEFYQQREEAITSFTAVIARFAEAQPGIEIFQRNVPNAQEMLVARIRSGDIPDVFTDWPTQRNFTSIVAEHAVADLTGQPFMANVSPRALDMTRSQDGHIYALPLNYNCMEVYFNTEIFARLGIAEPKTIAELLSLCDTLAADGTMPLVFCIRDYGRMAHIAQLILAVTVEDYLDVLSAFADGKISVEARENILGAMRLFRTLYGYSQAQGEAAYTYYDACERFASGGAAMMISGSYALNTINSFDTDIALDVFPFPGETADRRVMLSSIDTAVCVSASSAHQEEALAFLTFLTEPDTSALYASLDMGPGCLVDETASSPVTLKMGEHIDTLENVNWLKSRFSLETVALFSEAVDAYLLTGDEVSLWAALTAAFGTT